jgi:hypothetical protein
MMTTKLTISNYLALEEEFEGQQEFVDGYRTRRGRSGADARFDAVESGSDRILSSLVPELDLTVEQLLHAGM